MRLGQLARRLSIKTDKIVKYLNDEKDTQIGEHPNTKIPDEFVDDVIDFFKPEPIAEMKAALAEETPSTPQKTETPKEEVVINSIPEEEAEVIEEAPMEVEQPTEMEETASEETETLITDENVASNTIEEAELTEADLNIVDGIIKAPKQELEGVKVVGKIDLPTPKVEAEETSSEEGVNQETGETTDNVEASEKEEKPTRKPAKNKAKRKTPEQRKRQHEERKRKQEEEERKAREERKKELDQQKRKNHYLNQLEAIQKATPKKKKNKKPSTKKVKQEAPKGLWKKFLYWLNDKN